MIQHEEWAPETQIKIQLEKVLGGNLYLETL